MSGYGTTSHDEAVAYNQEFKLQMERQDPQGVIIIYGTDHMHVRQAAAEMAREYLLKGKSFRGGKIYRQKRVNKSRRVSNRRRRNKSRKTKRIR